MKSYLELEVIPNALNQSGCVIIIYRRWWIFFTELGRVTSRDELYSFLKHYSEFNGNRLK